MFQRTIAARGRAQLAGVAYGAIFLVVCFGQKLWKFADQSALASGRIDHFPIIDPGLSDAVVFDRNHMNRSIGQLGCVALLPFRTDRIVDVKSFPSLMRRADIKVGS